MDSEAKIILAFVFNRSGKTNLKETELYLPLSMELGWFSTKEAQQFLAYALKKGLLVKKDELLSLNFPLDAVKIPVGFTPSKKTFDDTTNDRKETNIVMDIVMQIAQQTHQEKNDIFEEIKREAKEKNLLVDVAAVYVARRYNVDVYEWYPSIEDSFIKGNKEESE
jgi:hypothetical protein